MGGNEGRKQRLTSLKGIDQIFERSLNSLRNLPARCGRYRFGEGWINPTHTCTPGQPVALTHRFLKPATIPKAYTATTMFKNQPSFHPLLPIPYVPLPFSCLMGLSYSVHCGTSFTNEQWMKSLQHLASLKIFTPGAKAKALKTKCLRRMY